MGIFGSAVVSCSSVVYVKPGEVNKTRTMTLTQILLFNFLTHR